MAESRALRLVTPLSYVIWNVILIADGFAGGGERMSGAAVQLRTLDALRGAPLWVHLRDHGVDADTFREAAGPFVKRIRAVQPIGLVSVNTHLDIAEEFGTAIHVGQRGPSVAEARQRLGEDATVSASVHTIEEAKEAVEQGAGTVLFSPVFPTDSKPGHPGMGLAALRACCEAVPEAHVAALGGITPDRMSPCLKAGALTVAVLSGILYASRPSEAAARYHAHLRRP